MATEYVEVAYSEILFETEKAVKVVIAAGREIWVPWSQIEDNGQSKPAGNLYVSRWFADKEGIPYSDWRGE